MPPSFSNLFFPNNLNRFQKKKQKGEKTTFADHLLIEYKVIFFVPSGFNYAAVCRRPSSVILTNIPQYLRDIRGLCTCRLYFGVCICIDKIR